MKRSDNPVYLLRHVAFADWMRGHLVNPGHMPDVIMQNGWEMRWARWIGHGQAEVPWPGHVSDSTNRNPGEGAHLVSDWVRRHLRPANEHTT